MAEQGGNTGRRRVVTTPQLGREMARARGEELRRDAERQRLIHRAQSRGAAEATHAPRAAGWLVRVVTAALRH